jgi:hypothetical protein
MRHIPVADRDASALHCDMNGIQGGTKPMSELHGIIIGPEMDEERAGIVIEHVIVDRRDFDVVVPQCLDQGIYLSGMPN